jgi:hypothetical protein
VQNSRTGQCISKLTFTTFFPKSAKEILQFCFKSAKEANDNIPANYGRAAICDYRGWLMKWLFQIEKHLSADNYFCAFTHTHTHTPRHTTTIRHRHNTIHCKKWLAIFPSLAGMSQTKLFLAWKNLIIPGQRDLVSDNQGWDRKIANLFLQCTAHNIATPYCIHPLIAGETTTLNSSMLLCVQV